jgi:suppressor of G2 allele of SKP1
MRYEFYQSTSSISFDVFIRGVSAEQSIVTVENEGRVLKLQLVTEGGDGISKTISDLSLNLYGTVLDTADSISTAFRASKVEIRLTKNASSLFMWPSAISMSGEAQGPVLPVPTLPLPTAKIVGANDSSTLGSSISAVSSTEPTSSSKKKDWNAVEREINAEEESEKPQGEEALFKLFRSIYSNANEDTKRAMVKSFQTSGGTVLSTNWDEVSKKDFEAEGIQAPSGMTVKKYEQ